MSFLVQLNKRKKMNQKSLYSSKRSTCKWLQRIEGKQSHKKLSSMVTIILISNRANRTNKSNTRKRTILEKYLIMRKKR